MNFHPSIETFLSWLESESESADNSDSANVPEPPQVDDSLGEQSLESESPNRKIPLPDLLEEELKWKSHYKLQQLLDSQQLPQAIALVEGLAQRLPFDKHVRQWQAIVYQCRGHQLVEQKKWKPARIYLQKSLKTDNNNRDLWSEVEQDYSRMERLQGIRTSWTREPKPKI